MAERKAQITWTPDNFKMSTYNKDGLQTSERKYKNLFDAGWSLYKGRKRLNRETVLCTGMGVTNFSLGLILAAYSLSISKNLEDLRNAGLFFGEGAGLFYLGNKLRKKRDFEDFKIKAFEKYRSVTIVGPVLYRDPGI